MGMQNEAAIDYFLTVLQTEQLQIRFVLQAKDRQIENYRRVRRLSEPGNRFRYAGGRGILVNSVRFDNQARRECRTFIQQIYIPAHAQ